MSDTVSSYSGVYSPAEMIQVNEIERLRSRVAQLEAALITIRDQHTLGTGAGVRADEIARAVLREEVKG